MQDKKITKGLLLKEDGRTTTIVLPQTTTAEDRAAIYATLKIPYAEIAILYFEGKKFLNATIVPPSIRCCTLPNIY